jgi:hypothetical protein
MALSLPGVASWNPVMAAVKHFIALRMQSVAVISGLELHDACNRNVLERRLPPVLHITILMHQ